MQSALKQLIGLCFLFVFAVSSIASAQTWNPRPGWKDSYAVGGKCYCDSNGYDHNLDSKFADTPIGRQNVVDICEAIERVSGDGPVDGRIPYNDIQCGNGPPNDAADEVGCPGRVDIGPEGCDQIGPKWDLDTVYANLPEDDLGLDRSNWVLTSSHNNDQVGLMVDNSLSTRWSTGTPQSSGQYISVDFGEPINFNRVVLDSYDDTNDYPRSFSVFVSTDGTNWGSPVLSGVGDRPVTIILLGSQLSRYLRITQTGSAENFWWSIHELNIFNDDDSQPIDPPTPEPPRSSGSAKHMGPITDLIINDSETE